MKYIHIFALLFSSFAYGKKLPELTTKQKLANIRFISSNNQFTYYQNQSGHLYLATNFSANVVLKRSPDTEFFLEGNLESGKILVQIHESFFENNSILKPSEFGVVDYGKFKYRKLDTGINPQLHLKAEWYSFYDSNQKMIFFKSLKNPRLSFNIELKNPISPFFVPKVLMLSAKEILFTDINNRGEMGILYFDRGEKAISPVYKSTLAGARVELCKLRNRIFIGEFSRLALLRKSHILSSEWNPNTQFKETTNHYRSDNNDIGKMICHESTDSIYFIRNLSDNAAKVLESSELAKLSTKDNTVTLISSLKNVSHVINMDSRILIPYRGKFFVAHGKNDAQSDKLEAEKK